MSLKLQESYSINVDKGLMASVSGRPGRLRMETATSILWVSGYSRLKKAWVLAAVTELIRTFSR